MKTIPVDLMATMIQGGRSGVARYIIELAKQFIGDERIDLRIHGLHHERHLLPRSNGGFARVPSVFQRGAADALRCMLNAPVRRGALLHIPSYRRVPWLHRGPVVATVHDLAPLHMKDKYGWARYHFIKDLVPVGLRRCQHIITVTEHTRQDVIRHFNMHPERVSVAQCGLDHQRFHPGESSEALLRCRRHWPELADDCVLYTARIEHPGKGHVALIDAWSHWGKSAPQLVFAGAACERSDEVMAHAKKRGVKILCTGFVPDEVLPDLYRACRTFVFPSRYEGFGLPPIEAMACGAVVASSRSAALAETAGPAARLNPDDPEAMASTIRRCCEDESLRSELKTQGVAWARSFTWSQCARSVARIYAKVLGESRKADW